MMPIAIHTRPLPLDAFLSCPKFSIIPFSQSRLPVDSHSLRPWMGRPAVSPSPENPALLQTAMEELRKLNDDDLVLIISIMHRLNKN